MKLRLVAFFVLAALAFVACGGGSDEESSVAQPEPTQPAATVAATVEPASIDEAEPTAAPEPTATEVAEEEPEPTAEVATAPAATSENGCGSGVVPGSTTQQLAFEDRDRIFERVIPGGYDDVTPLPVVLNWHGLGSNGTEQLAFSDYPRLAEAEGFIVIAPTGVPGPGEDRNSWELVPEQDPTRDDLAFANELLNVVIETLCVDASRVYTTGMSNGGYFSSVLACEMSGRIAAAASVAALSHADDCDPERVVPYIGFHGTDDEVVPFDGGGESSLAPGQSVPLFLLKIPDEFAEFAVAAGCDVDPVATNPSPNVISYDYQDCTDDVQMTFYEIQGAGHTWPGSAISLAISEAAGLGVTTDEIQATETSWAFFKQYSLAD